MALAGLFAGHARAALTVLVGEPYGSFGAKVPSGHTTIYLDRVCADGPVRLRMCLAGEPAGVAIARYRDLGHTDWTATPILEFLYAAERADGVMTSPTPEMLLAAREQYRRSALLLLVPDASEDDKSSQDWTSIVGVAYVRRVWGYRLATTRDQDTSFVTMMNGRPNQSHYRGMKDNCADLAANIVNFYFPGTVRSDRVADLGVMSPKQVARSVYAYGQAHPAAQLKVVVVPQVAGPLPRSRTVRGATETFMTSGRYAVPIAVLQPELYVADVVLYLSHGRWKVARAAEIVGPETIGAMAED